VKSEARNLPPYNWLSRFSAKLDPLVPVHGKYVDARSGFAPEEGCCPTAVYENEANAQLIAAAPDLLAALIDIVSKFDACSSEVVRSTPLGINKARSAIAKATVPRHGRDTTTDGAS
jgi:hypothetical protein